ncbi:hypothetical protein ABZ801_28395 [Actinomadura sp. NPDC047616]|uniref:hypothetical protein n=1 Tax=Actinomadura sp. NPDC047616 TaxID=3155914 RepID=UPI0033D8B6A1
MDVQEQRVVPLAAAVPADVADAGAPPADRVEALVAAGRPVLVTLVPDDPGSPEPDAGLLAAAAVYAWLGVRTLRVPETQEAAVRQVVDMVASIRGTRPPALTRRGLA